MQKLRRGQDSSEPRPSCIKMPHSCLRHGKPVTSVIVYPFLAKSPSSFCATESACPPSWKLCKSCQLFCSYSNYRIIIRSFVSIISLAVLVSVHVWILHKCMQHVSICKSVCLPFLSGSSIYPLYPISSKAIYLV